MKQRKEKLTRRRSCNDDSHSSGGDPKSPQARPFLGKFRLRHTSKRKQIFRAPHSPFCNPLTRGLSNLSSARAIARRAAERGKSVDDLRSLHRHQIKSIRSNERHAADIIQLLPGSRFCWKGEGPNVSGNSQHSFAPPTNTKNVGQPAHSGPLLSNVAPQAPFFSTLMAGHAEHRAGPEVPSAGVAPISCKDPRQATTCLHNLAMVSRDSNAMQAGNALKKLSAC